MHEERARRPDARLATPTSTTEHYTPAPVALHLVTQSVGRWLWRGAVPGPAVLRDPGELANRRWREPTEVLGLRILDPACGDGAFLVAARDVILGYLGARALALGTTPPSAVIGHRVAQEVLHGVDLDPAAVAAARRRLGGPPGRGRAVAAGEALPLRCGNALVTPAMLAAVGAPAAARRRLRPWDPAGPDGFPAVLARGGFDFVLGNPPFGTGSRLMPLERGLFRSAYALAATGQPDLFQLFYERSLGALLRPGGLHVFLVPDALLARDELAATRRCVTESLAITRITAFGAVFRRDPAAGRARAVAMSPAEAGRVAVSVVGIVGAMRPARVRPTVVVERWGAGRAERQSTLPRAWLCPDQGEPWSIAAPLGWFGPRGFRARLEAPGLRLGDLLLPGAAGLTRGEELGKAGLPRLDPGARCAAGHVPILAGGDLRRGAVAGPRHQVPLVALRKRTTVELVPRLLLVKTGGGLVAAASTDPLPVLQSVYVLHLTTAARARIGEAVLAAVLSSAVVTAYAWYRWTSGKALHPQLTLGNVRELPLPTLPALAAARAELAALLVPRTPSPPEPPRSPQRAGQAGAAPALPRPIAAERALDERVAELFGMDFRVWEPIIFQALAALPPTQRSGWFDAPPGPPEGKPPPAAALRTPLTRRRRAR